MEDAKKDTPDPAWVIFEVEDMNQNRLGWPAAAERSSTLWMTGNSSVRVWMA